MKYIPLLFSTPMVKAIMGGVKTQTRRIMKPQHTEIKNWHDIFLSCPYGQPGDVLWVRETFFYGGEMDENEQVSECRYWYKAESDWGQFEGVDENENLRNGPKWKPSIFMPKVACRIFLEVTDIRVERLQDISEQDSLSEGVIGNDLGHFIDYIKPKTAWKTSAKSSYQSLWESINGPESWNHNPWVWVIGFKRVECPKGFC